MVAVVGMADLDYALFGRFERVASECLGTNRNCVTVDPFLLKMSSNLFVYATGVA